MLNAAVIYKTKVKTTLHMRIYFKSNNQRQIFILVFITQNVSVSTERPNLLKKGIQQCLLYPEI